MVTRDGIEQLRRAWQDNYYGALRAEQTTDEVFYNDTFPVGIKKPYKTVRTGSARKAVDTIAENIISTNPKVYREKRKDNETSEAHNIKVSRLLNHWVNLLIPDIQCAIKYLPRRGESFLQTEWFPDEKRPLIYAPDPMYIFPDPVEKLGIPNRVIKTYETTVGVMKQRYNEFKTDKQDNEKIKYLAYWDYESRYIEADTKALVTGDVHSNVLKVTPFIHILSGLGITGIDVPPEQKIVSKIRPMRDILVEECEMESMIHSIIGLWANPVMIIWSEVEGKEVSPEEARNIDLSPGGVVRLPFGMKFQVVQGSNPSPEMFKHLENIKQRLGLEVPPVTSGIASGSRTSGRLEDILGESFKNKYRMMAFNVAEGVSRALSMALRMAVEVGAFPINVFSVETVKGKPVLAKDEVTVEDLEDNYQCHVELESEDPIDKDRNLQMLRVLVNEHRITWRRFLIEGYGMTEDEADNEIDEVVAETAYLENPIIKEMVVREAIEKAGGYKYLRELQGAPVTQMGEQGQGIIQGQAQSQQARVMTTDTSNRETLRQMIQQSPYGVRSPANEEEQAR